MWSFWSITTLLGANHFITEVGEGLGFSCLLEFLSFMSGRSHFLWIHTWGKNNFSRIFFPKFTSKFKQMFIKWCFVELKLYKEKMRSVHTLIRTTRTCIYPLYRVLLGSKFSKLIELLCNYKDVFVCSSHNYYFVLPGSVHIPAVLYNVLVSTCSSILNVYVATCFYIKHIYLHRVCLDDPIELNKQNFIIGTIIIPNIKNIFFCNKVLLSQCCLLNQHCIHFLKILLILFDWMYSFEHNYKMVNAFCDINLSIIHLKENVFECEH